MAAITFAQAAPPLHANGYTPFPVIAATKQSRIRRWQLLCGRTLSERELRDYVLRHSQDSVALACGVLLAVDIDSRDEERAEEIERFVFQMAGFTPLVRTGQPPKRALFYRAEGFAPPTRRFPQLDILGMRAYVVAFGEHPKTGRQYEWRNVSPLDLPFADAPAISARLFDELLSGLERKLVGHSSPQPTTSPPSSTQLIVPTRAGPWLQDRRGRVVDGRDAYLAHLIWMKARAGADSVDKIAIEAWSEFSATADLTRNRRDGLRPWLHTDAVSKAKSLIASGKLDASCRVRPKARQGAFWTEPTKRAFSIRVAEAGSMRELSPAAVKVSNHMLGVIHGDGVCFVNTPRIASELDLALATVKRARQHLVDRGFWNRSLANGGRGKVALYQPNPAVLGRAYEEAPKVDFDETVDGKAILIPSEEGIDWDEEVLPKNKIQVRLGF